MISYSQSHKFPVITPPFSNYCCRSLAKPPLPPPAHPQFRSAPTPHAHTPACSPSPLCAVHHNAIIIHRIVYGHYPLSLLSGAILHSGPPKPALLSHPRLLRPICPHSPPTPPPEHTFAPAVPSGRVPRGVNRCCVRGRLPHTPPLRPARTALGEDVSGLLLLLLQSLA